MNKISVQAKARTHTVMSHVGFFEVISGTSHRSYVVTPLGGMEAVCTCEARGKCSHVLAVIEYAKKLLLPEGEASDE